MAEDATTATSAVEGVPDAPKGAEAPEKDWQAEYEKLLKQSRKHEERAKANFEKAKAYDDAAKHAEDADNKLTEATDRAERAEKELAALKAERERADMVQKVADGASVPANLLSLMRGDTAEELERAAKALAGYTQSMHLYPSVPDGGAQGAPTVTKESISAIKDRNARMRARAEHADLYK